MKQEDFEKKMEKMTSPDISSEVQRKHLKIMLLSARRSAYAGILLLLLPFLFAISNISKYGLGIDLSFITVFIEWIMTLDTVPVVNWLIRFLLVGGPFVALLINLFAILHFYTDRDSNEFVMTVKLKWLNIAIILFCAFILFLFSFYLVSENFM